MTPRWRQAIRSLKPATHASSLRIHQHVLQSFHGYLKIQLLQPTSEATEAREIMALLFLCRRSLKSTTHIRPGTFIEATPLLTATTQHDWINNSSGNRIRARCLPPTLSFHQVTRTHFSLLQY